MVTQAEIFKAFQMKQVTYYIHVVLVTIILKVLLIYIFLLISLYRSFHGTLTYNMFLFLKNSFAYNINKAKIQL